MQAIITKYLPATNHKGSRIKATCERGSIILPWDDELNEEDNHVKAADDLCEAFAQDDVESYGTNPNKNPWKSARAHGGIPSGEWVHAFVSSVK